MNKNFSPDYRRIVNAALNKPGKIPLYEHNISNEVISTITDRDMSALLAAGDASSLNEYFRLYADFHINCGYDNFSFEGCVTELVQNGAGLTGHGTSIIKTEKDFYSWDWKELPLRYFERFGPRYKKTLSPSGECLWRNILTFWLRVVSGTIWALKPLPFLNPKQSGNM